MESPPPSQLVSLTPRTLGVASGLGSPLQASLANGRWRVQWHGADGRPVAAESAVGSGTWTEPAAGAAPVAASPAGLEAASPVGLLLAVAAGSGRAGLRSSRRVIGVPPRFPNASVVLCREEAGAWRDVAFAGETPEIPVGSVTLAVSPTHWLAAYATYDTQARASVRVVELALSAILPAATTWRQLPAYPLAPGVAGPMAGQHKGVLISVGGANFPDLKPWEGGKKRYFDEIYVLEPGAKAWRTVGKLPIPRGYGATVSLPDGVLICGGENLETVFSDTLLLRWTGSTVQVSPGPTLPGPTTCAVASVLNNSVYLAGGYVAGAPKVSQNAFWQLDLGAATPQWKVLPSWTGPSRALAVSAALGGSFYLFSGIEIAPLDGKEGPGVYLKDAHRYTPGRGWEKLPDVPWSVIAAASPAPVSENPARIYVLGGVDGRQVGKIPRDSSLPGDILYFDVATNQWGHCQERWPTPVVCIPAVQIGREWVLPTGELMAGVRTTEVWAWQAPG
jgi:N-acetylneuraminate epimerase